MPFSCEDGLPEVSNRRTIVVQDRGLQHDYENKSIGNCNIISGNCNMTVLNIGDEKAVLPIKFQ